MTLLSIFFLRIWTFWNPWLNCDIDSLLIDISESQSLNIGSNQIEAKTSDSSDLLKTKVLLQ